MKEVGTSAMLVVFHGMRYFGTGVVSVVAATLGFLIFLFCVVLTLLVFGVVLLPGFVLGYWGNSWWWVFGWAAVVLVAAGYFEPELDLYLRHKEFERMMDRRAR